MPERNTVNSPKNSGQSLGKCTSFLTCWHTSIHEENPVSKIKKVNLKKVTAVAASKVYFN
jgi:succinate dehydrogenase/fumarate reductase-like Fe-S protein